jgi:electron transfer flavoprotein beta subunit
VRKLGKYDLILAGRQAIDGDTAQVGPQTAEKLDIPQVTYVSKLEVKGDTVTVHRDLEDGYQVIEVKMPCLLTAVNGLGKPRYPKFPGIFAAYEAEIEQWNMKKIGLASSTGIGLKGSPTKVFRSFSPKIERAGVVFPDAGRASVSQLADSLRDRNLV